MLIGGRDHERGERRLGREHERAERREDLDSSPLLSWAKEERVKYTRAGLVSDETLAQLEAVARRAARLDEAKETLDAVKRRVAGLAATNVAVDVDGLVRAIEALDAHVLQYVA